MDRGRGVGEESPKPEQVRVCTKVRRFRTEKMGIGFP